MIPGLADFCFPSGIQPTKLRKTKSNSNLLQVLYSQSYNHEQDNAFVFMLTTIEKELLYGVCVVKHESVRVSVDAPLACLLFSAERCLFGCVVDDWLSALLFVCSTSRLSSHQQTRRSSPVMGRRTWQLRVATVS